MNRFGIFYIFKEEYKLETVINNIHEPNDNYTKKIEIYMANKANQFIKYHNPTVEFKEYAVYTMPYLPKYLSAVVLTKTNTNHPYLMYFNLEDVYITFLIPFGKERRQSNINDYNIAITEGTIPERTAILILLEKTIFIRKKGILDSKQFSLISCKNISNCVKKINEIQKMQLSASEKEILKYKYNEYYLNKALDFLKIYFQLLENKNYNEAFLFLKGKESKYFGKERLNTFFKNTRMIIGHLEIFISLYELFHNARIQLFNF